MNDGLTLILKQNFDCNLDCDKYISFNRIVINLFLI